MVLSEVLYQFATIRFTILRGAQEWVELPNATGMVLFADGGQLASKPYAASGSYINKMSDYCKDCHYSVKERFTEDACPFNSLYWDFMHRHTAWQSSHEFHVQKP